MHYVRDSERAIRIPRALRSLDRRYVAAWERLAARNQTEPTTMQLATELEVSFSTVEQLQALRGAPAAGDAQHAADSIASSPAIAGSRSKTAPRDDRRR